MAKFIKLTMDIGPTWLGVNHILGFFRHGAMTQVATVVDRPEPNSGDRLYVKETPEQILKLIEDAQ